MNATADTGVPDEDGDAGEERRMRRWPIVVLGAALLALAAGAVLWGVNERSDTDEARSQLGRQRDAVLAATGFVEALMSYDHDDLDAQQAAVERFASDQFRADFTDAFTSEVRDQIVEEQATSVVTVEDVWLTVEDGDGEEVSAIVHALSTVSSDGGATADLESYLRVRLVRLDGRWLVDDLTSLGSRDLSAPLAPPDSTAEDRSDG
ncbi:hypothetical protein NHL50_03455 [Acidimicrobiia bacterium EGI L10123]|uniref:hypothetical protein n=1 Tax=Salinilacustrithrix flava TaxID=2957203 RepID=UPI003D7C3562|nr:hypothetical protein [Acidimicrobiia bacterium EGI L10123]